MSDGMKSFQPTDAHRAFMADLKAALAKHVHLTPVEMLAISAQFVGNLVTFQDQTRHSSEQVMAMVAENIQIGNRTALQSVMGEPKGSA